MRSLRQFDMLYLYIACATGCLWRTLYCDYVEVNTASHPHCPIILGLELAKVTRHSVSALSLLLVSRSCPSRV